MFGRNRSTWQAGMVIAGLAIVAVVLIAPRAVSLVTTPAAVVAPSNSLPVVGQSTQATQSASAAGDQGTQAAPPAQAPAADPGAGAGVSASGSSSGAKTGAHAGASTGALPAVTGAAPAVNAVNKVGQTLFSDNFASDPLGQTLPSGWQLNDSTSASTQAQSGSGGLPILGGLLNTLGVGTTAGQVTDLVPSVVNLGGTHVLSRVANSWSHLSAGSAWADYSVSADLKSVSAGAGFMGVAGRFQSSGTFLTCGIQNGNTLDLMQVVNGQAQMLASTPLSAPTNVFNTVQMTMKGASVSCGMNGTTLLNANGASITSGKVGLVALGDLASQFSNIKAVALP